MNLLLVIFVMLALAGTQVLAGGRQIALCLPAYGLLALGAFLSWWPRRHTPIPRSRMECLAAAVLLAAYISIRAFCSPEEYLARRDLYLALATLTLYLLVALNLTSSKWRVGLVSGIMVLAVANCALGAMQFFRGHSDTPLDFLPRPDYGSRISGFYGYPNHLAGFLEISLLLALAMAFWSRWPIWAKLLSGYVSLVCLAGLIATGSRGGYIATAVGLLVFCLLSLTLIGKLAPGRVIAVFLAGILLIAGLAWGVRAVVAKSFELNWRASATLTVDATRMRLWQAAWKQFRLHPAVGTGSGTYLYYGRQFRSPAVQTDPIHAHNDYFELLAEYGIVGIIAAVIFLETHLRTGWTSLRSRLAVGSGASLSSHSIALNVGALSAAAACLTHSLLDFNLHIAANMLVMAFVFALLGSPGTGPETAPAEEPEADLPAFLRLALPALGVCIAVRVLPSAPAEYYAERSRTLVSDWHFLAAPDLPREVLDFAQRGLNYDPRNPELYFCQGRAYSSLADLESDPAIKDDLRGKAIVAFGKAVEFAPRDEVYLLLEAAALDAAHRFAEADPLLARAVELDPKSSRVLYALAAHLEAQGKFADAIQRYQESMRLGGGSGAQFRLDRIEEAQKAKGPAAPPGPEKSDLR